MDDLRTVGDLVNALVCTYSAALEYHNAWQQRRRQENHYRTQATSDAIANGGGGGGGGGFCAVRASLNFSGHKINEAFVSGVDVFGDDFAVGDDACRLALQDSLGCLRKRTETLRRAAAAAADAGGCPLELHELIGVSEAARIASLAALSRQYHRVAVSRLSPRGLPRPQPQHQHQSWLDFRGAGEASRPVVDDDDEDAQSAAYRLPASPNSGGNGGIGGGGKSPFHSEPPSPPPTPKMVPDDLQSTCASSLLGPQPKNGVFSVFCPEAMKYQVDPGKRLPGDGDDDDGDDDERRWCRCRCGYDWRRGTRAGDGVVVINDGFQITPRFLGKSHCGDGFGCVLCTSRGKTETYGNVEDLRDHINASHTKWQLLHDRDLVGR